MSARSDEIACSFVEAMAAAGIKPAEPIMHDLLSGKLVRFKAGDDRRPNSWARLHFDGRPAGAFGCHKRGISEKWKADQTIQSFTAREKSAYAKEMKAKRRAAADQKDLKQRATAGRAQIKLDGALPASSHPYLAKKRMSGKGLFQMGNLLLVPMRDVMGNLWNIQFIDAHGNKKFLTDGRVDGLFWVTEGVGRICVGEGVGTMGAIHRASGATCYAAFSAGNLLAVAKAVRVIHPHAQIIICADDDAHLVAHPTIKRNIGIDAAAAAAEAIGGCIALPRRSNVND